MANTLDRTVWGGIVAVMVAAGPGREAAALPIAAPPSPKPRPEAAAADLAEPKRAEMRGADAAKPGNDAPRLKAREMKPAAGADGEAADRPAGRSGYLGIYTGAVSDELRAHLELPEDCGLVIRRVAPGSPAEKAGLEANDILLEFGGRKVTSPLEFTEMVQGAKGGAKVRLVVVRRGKRKTVDAVIEAREALAGEDGRPAGGPQGMRPGNIAGLPPLPFNFNGQMLEQQLQGQIGAAIAQGLAQAQAQAAAGPGGMRLQTSTVTINGRTTTTTIASDDAGTIEMRAADGKRTVSIRGADGREIHAGPLDRDADYRAVPEAWRQKLRDVEARSRGFAPGAGGVPGNAL